MQNEPINGHHVPLIALAAELGFSAGSIRKAVQRRGFTPICSANRRNFLTAEDAARLREQIEAERAHRVVYEKPEEAPGISGVYAVEVPAYEGATRVKLGWSERMDQRLATYRTLIPDLRVLAVWHTPDAWVERMLLKRAAVIGRRVGEELFEFDDTPAAVADLAETVGRVGIS